MTDAATNVGMSVAAAATDARRRVAIITSLVLILAAAGAALFLVRGVDTQLAEMTRTYAMRKHAHDVILAITEAETGQRGYLLTQDAAYLEPYQRATASITGNYDQLLGLLAQDPVRQGQMEALREQIDTRWADMASTIQLAGSGQLAEALERVRSGEGRSIMGEIALELRAFIDQEDARLAQHNDDVERYRQWLVAAILAALAGAATLAYALFNGTQKQVSALAQTRNFLQQQNERLEEHVRRRTAEVEEARAYAERERQRVEALLQDTNHRIGNSLATVSSLLGMQMQRSDSNEVRVALEAAQSRVQAIASGHRRLRLGADLETTQADEFLSAVIEDIRSGQAGDSAVTIVTRFEPLIISARDATTIGIVVGELITNALKHAFSESASGTIWVSLTRNGDGVITLTVEDDGKGFKDTTAEGGLGSMIIKQLARQFDGKPSYTQGSAGGACVAVTLPALDRELQVG